MTVLDGAIASSPIAGSNSPALVPSLSDYSFDAAAQDDVGVLPAGTLSGQYPVSTTPLTLGGSVSTNFGTDFFADFTFDPEHLNAGFINSTSTHNVKLWNRIPYAVELTGVSGVPEGVTLTLEPGDMFDRYQERTFGVTIERDGPAILGGTIVFTFDNGDSIGLEVTGVRARLWPYSPNWSENYVSNYAYRTESTVSRSGREQRRALRHNARYYSEFGVTLAGGQLAYFDAMMGGWQNKPFVMPDFTEYTTLVGTGADTIEVSSVPQWLTDHVTIVVESSVYLVTGVAGTTFTVTPLVGSHAPEARVTLGRTGLIAATSTNALQTDTVSRFKVRFDAYPDSRPPVEPPAASLTYRGREVFLKKPNWSSPPQVTFDWPVDAVDPGFGRNVFFQVIDFCKRSVQATFTGKTYAEVLEIRNFFDRMRGARGEFYAPTWSPDMTLAAPWIDGSTSLTVTGSHVYDFLRDSTVHRCMAIILTNGTILLRERNSVTLDGGNTVIGVTQALPVSSVASICWLHAWTLASDILTVTWLTDTVAQIGLTMRTVEDLDV